MKLFVIIHHLVADSGHKIIIVKADREEEAIRKYHEAFPDRCVIGVQAVEVTENVQTVFEYDNPYYEG